MVIQGGSFKGKSGDLKPKEVVSLLLDDEEIEKRVKVKLEEEEEKVEKEKKEKSKAKKREAAVVKADHEKKPKLEIEVNEESNNIDGSVNNDDSKPLYDFDGDKMGPKKAKGLQRYRDYEWEKFPLTRFVRVDSHNYRRLTEFGQG